MQNSLIWLTFSVFLRSSKKTIRKLPSNVHLSTVDFGGVKQKSNWMQRNVLSGDVICLSAWLGLVQVSLIAGQIKPSTLTV